MVWSGRYIYGVQVLAFDALGIPTMVGNMELWFCSTFSLVKLSSIYPSAILHKLAGIVLALVPSLQR